MHMHTPCTYLEKWGNYMCISRTDRTRRQYCTAPPAGTRPHTPSHHRWGYLLPCLPWPSESRDVPRWLSECLLVMTVVWRKKHDSEWREGGRGETEGGREREGRRERGRERGRERRQCVHQGNVSNTPQKYILSVVTHTHIRAWHKLLSNFWEK